MTDNLSKFYEFMSTLDEETNEKVSKLGKDELLAFAAEKGIALTEVDFENTESEGEVDLDEADSVAGGSPCVCALGGGGKKSDITDAPSCACVVYGQGKAASDHEEGCPMRCVCPVAGGGSDCVGSPTVCNGGGD